MTPRERLLAALKGEPVDRVPVWLLFPYHTTGYYVDVRANPCYVPIFERSKRSAVMLNRRNPKVSLFAPEVEDRGENVDEDGWRGYGRTISYRGRSMSQYTLYRDGEVKQKKMLQSEDDLDFLLTLPLKTDPKRIVAELDAQADQYLRERSEFPLDCGAMMLDMGEPIAFLYINSELTEYPVWSIACPEKVEQFLNQAMKVYREVYRYCLERDWADVYFLVGSELASPPLVGRETFQRWIVPYARELIEMIHSYGKLALQHYHGQIKMILQDFVAMGADGLHTIESPPTGDCTLTEACRVVNNRITLIGNVQYDLFRSLTPREMREEVARVLDEVKGHRFILSPTAGPYEKTVSQRIIDNYMAFLDAADRA